MNLSERLLAFLGALMAGSGVALSAYAQHIEGGDLLRTGAMFLLIHGVAVIGAAAFGWAGTMHLMGWGALILAAGTCLFAGDLASRALQGHSLFAYAAPTGGGAMIVAWAWLALAFLAG